MKYPRYEYSTEAELNIFEFESIGPKGKIIKLVQYTEMNIKGYYNLAFGDLNIKTREINDDVITNNGDATKVLATVVSTIYAFTGKYPDTYIFATGSSEARTRLYRMGITNNLEELKNDFYVYGLKSDETFEPFIAGEDYLGFLITRKNKIMKVEDLNKAKIPVVKINKKLEEFKGKILFPKKLDLANKMLDKVKLPKV